MVATSQMQRHMKMASLQLACNVAPGQPPLSTLQSSLNHKCEVNLEESEGVKSGVKLYRQLTGSTDSRSMVLLLLAIIIITIISITMVILMIRLIVISFHYLVLFFLLFCRMQRK